MKKTVIILVLLLVAVFVVVGYQKSKSQKQQNTPDSQKTNQTASSQLNSISGTVKLASGSNFLILMSDGKTTTVAAKTNTVILKRNTTKDGITTVPAKVTDIKVGSQIVVYTKSAATDTTLNASTIEIVK